MKKNIDIYTQDIKKDRQIYIELYKIVKNKDDLGEFFIEVNIDNKLLRKFNPSFLEQADILNSNLIALAQNNKDDYKKFKKLIREIK